METDKLISLEWDKDRIKIVPHENFDLRLDYDGLFLQPKKQKYYPKTYSECCTILGIVEYHDWSCGYNAELMYDFCKLIVCRDAYWEFANWKPDWKDATQKKHSIQLVVGEIADTRSYRTNSVLTFPTEEMRDAFRNNFKDLIERCKELI